MNVPYQPRAPRVSPSGGRARLADVGVSIVNLSRTGALVRAPKVIPTGARLPVTLDLTPGPISVTATVVRSEASPPLVDDGVLRRQFAIALSFVKPSADAQARLAALCGRPHGRYGVRLGPIHISGARYCPRCFSRAVMRGQRRRYTCDACQHTFFGLRLGLVRIAI